MSILESHPHIILSLAKFTAALLLGIAVAPLIKRPALRAAFWTAMFLILPTMILVTHGRSILNILPVPTEMPTVTVQMESTKAPVSPPAPIVVATPLAQTPPTISPVPTKIEAKPIEAPALAPPTPARKINWLVAIYFIGLIASLLPILISMLRIRFAPKKSASDTAIEVWSMIRPQESKVVPLYLTNSPSAPFTCGLIRPEVLLPESSGEWSMRRLRSTLYHESAHISRRDPLVRMFACLVRAIFWFHPLVWLAHSRLVAAQEEACDEIALGSGIAPDEYAEDLLETAKHAQGHLGHALALARWSQLGSRIRIILQTNTAEIKKMNKKTIATVTLGIAALCIGISMIGFNSQKPSSADQPEETARFSNATKTSRVLSDPANTAAMSLERANAKPKPELTEDPSILLNDRQKRPSLSKAQITTLVLRWLKTDQAAAINWLDTTPQVDGWFIAEIAFNSMEQDEAATMAWVEALPASYKRVECFEKLSELLLANIDSQEAFDAKVATMPPKLQDVAHMQWISKGHVSQAETERLTAIYQRDPELIYSVLGKSVWSSLTSFYVRNGNYSEGINYAKALPDEASQADHVRDLFKTWVEMDAKAAAAAVNNMPQGHMRDAAATSITSDLIRKDPAAAFEWAQSISNEEKRRKFTRYALEDWMQRKPNEAMNALQSLPPEERQQLFPDDK